jgi:hypothetical protein
LELVRVRNNLSTGAKHSLHHLGASHKAWWSEDIEARLDGLAKQAGAVDDRCEFEAGRARMRLPADGLPILLSNLAQAPIPPIDTLSVTGIPANGEEGAETYRVEITFLLSPAAPGGR